MAKTDLIIVSVAAISAILNVFLLGKTFKFKDALWTLISAAKDGKIDETEFQEITDNIKKDLYGN